MSRAPTVVRASAVLLVCAGGLSACTGTGTTAPVSPGAPSVTAVVSARFTIPVDLDHGGFLVTPPPARSSATVTEHDADAMFDATDAVMGPHEFAILGLGLVTVASRIENPPPASTVPLPSPLAPTTTASTTTAPTTAKPTSATASTTTTTTTTTTPAPTTTAPSPSTTAPPPTTTTTTLPPYHGRLAWVGIAWGATGTCAGSTTTAPATGTTGYVAVVIDARQDHRVIAYRSGGPAPCSGATRTPSVTEPDELLSVPWQPVGPASTAVRIQVPPCGHYYGWTQVPATGGSVADQIVVAVPFDPMCGSTVAQGQTVDQVVPLGSGQGLVLHAPVGPVQALQALPSS